MTDVELELAVSAARREARRIDADLTTATVTAAAGIVAAPNTGERCASGRLLRITLIGDFPGVVATGHPVVDGEHPDFTVRAMGLTADAATGRVCKIGVSTGPVRPDPGATVLDLG